MTLQAVIHLLSSISYGSVIDTLKCCIHRPLITGWQLLSYSSVAPIFLSNSFIFEWSKEYQRS